MIILSKEVWMKYHLKEGDPEWLQWQRLQFPKDPFPLSWRRDGFRYHPDEIANHRFCQLEWSVCERIAFFNLLFKHKPTLIQSLLNHVLCKNCPSKHGKPSGCKTSSNMNYVVYWRHRIDLHSVIESQEETLVFYKWVSLPRNPVGAGIAPLPTKVPLI